MNKLYKYIIAVIILALSVDANAQETVQSLSGAIEKALEKNYGIIISNSEVEISEINNNWGTEVYYQLLVLVLNQEIVRA